MPTPVLDWKPNHDPRSRNYSIRAALGTGLERRDRQWAPGPVLDQRAEGACVGFAFASEALADPIPVDVTRLRATVPHNLDHFARFLYGMAKYIDEWPDENYEGTSVNAGAKSARNIGILNTYHWAFDIDAVIDAVCHVGPVVIGSNWHQGMYDAPGGVLTPSGPVVGGHAYLLTGFRLSSFRLGGAPSLTVKNSWGTGWGTNGLAEIGIPHMAALLAQSGEACIPTSRSYGR